MLPEKTNTEKGDIMRKKLLTALLTMCIFALVISGFTSCDSTPATKLTTPVVTLSGNVASWEADANADKFEISLDGALSYVENSVTSKTLTNGQTLKIRAVGDGDNYSTSDWSNTVTFTDGNSPQQPVKLGTPNVTVSGTGLASWSAIANASGYAYKINGGTETATNATSVQLTNGQSITVKSVGDGTNYIDSDYSTSKSYTTGGTTPPPATPENAPSYLGIFASNTQPSSDDGLPDAFLTRTASYFGGAYRDFRLAMKEYFSNTNNHIGTSLPSDSGYTVCSRAGETVYIQIWLNNPNQYSIISLKLNGTKYQVSGGLSSFFIEEGGQHYNCVYVAVTIPNGTYTEKSYTVSDIEYINGTYINPDGTDQFMNNNDTVKIGLPYNKANPIVSDFTPTNVTVNSASATFNLSDADGIANTVGGWLGIAVYDGYNVVANQALTLGNNSVTVTGLVENTYYWAIVYLYADLHDGNGVTAHTLFDRTISTPEAITASDISGALIYDSQKDGYYGAVKVNTVLNSQTAQYIKLEILDGEESVIYTSNTYSGSATVSDGILNGESYKVRVYYKDTEYPDGKYIEEYVWLDSLRDPEFYDVETYVFVKDAVLYFKLRNNDNNYAPVSGFNIKLYHDESTRWIAEDVLYLLRNPNAISELEAQYDEYTELMDTLDSRDRAWLEASNKRGEIESRINTLENLDDRITNEFDNNRDEDFWETELAKGKYLYEFTYSGTDSENVFRAGEYYYVLLDEAMNNGTDTYSLEIEYTYNKNDGNTDNTVTRTQDIRFRNELNDIWVVIDENNASYNNGQLTLSIYNEGNEPYEIGYVYKIVVNGKTVYLDDSVRTLNIDEAALKNAYITRIKAGQSVEGLIGEFIHEYESSYRLPVDISDLSAGSYTFDIYIRTMVEPYDGEDYHARRHAYNVAICKQIPTPTIEISDDHGRVVFSEVNIYNWNGAFEYIATDKNGNPITISKYGEGIGDRFYLPEIGSTIQVKMTADGFWLESQWSEPFVFNGVNVAAPVLEYSLEDCAVRWSFDDTSLISHYVYTVNGGSKITVELDEATSVILQYNDVIRVKCVANSDAAANGYADSIWAEYRCTDNRTALAAPINLRADGSGALRWDKVDGALSYVVEMTLVSTGRVITQTTTGEEWGVSTRYTYRVRAVPENTENYKPSAWSERFTPSSGDKG